MPSSRWQRGGHLASPEPATGGFPISSPGLPPTTGGFRPVPPGGHPGQYGYGQAPEPARWDAGTPSWLSGADASTLTSIDFLTDTNSGGGLTGAFAVRYQSVGLNAALSDKVFGAAIGGGGQPPVVPLPPAVWMGLVTMGMIGVRQLRQRKLLAAA